MVWAVIAYLAIGLFIGLGRLSRGIQGQAGPAATLVGWVILWPVVLIFEKVAR